MSVFEFRQWIESLLPWWAPFAIPCVGLAALGISAIWQTINKAKVKRG